MLVVKNLPVNAGDLRDLGLIPQLGRSPGGGYGNPFQYSCLENPIDRGAWRATVHWVTESNTPEATWHACMSYILSGNNCPHSNRLSEAASQRWDGQVPSVMGPAQSLMDICLKYTCDHCFNRQRHEAQLTMSWSYRVTTVNFSSVFKAYYYMQLLAPALEFPFLGCFFQL